ncbi:MAG: NAD(P)-dependent oxidoreductase [Aestuariivirga sp.]
MSFKVLICDHVGLAFDAKGVPDPSEVAAHIKAMGGVFHFGTNAETVKGKINFYYAPELSTRDELLKVAGNGQFDAVIAAATFIPAECGFALGGVRIGTGTGNMQSASWGGANGLGGAAPLMNTPGFNARATAQMTMKALMHFRPTLPFDELHARVVAGTFDTGKDLQGFPTAKLEGQTIAILGCGNIGREVAKLAAAFGMKVKVYAREKHHARIAADGFIPVSNAVEAARSADVISIHTGLGAVDPATGRTANTGFINDEILAALNKGSTLLNFDRGECVDAAALARAMASGQVANAAIDADIFNTSGKLSGPMLPYLPLAEKFANRILLLPHAAADTDHPSRVAGAKQAVDQIIDAILNKRVTNLKGDLPQGYTNAGVKLGV